MRYHRNSILAFPRTAQYGAAIERPLPSLWRRFVQHVVEILS